MRLLLQWDESKLYFNRQCKNFDSRVEEDGKDFNSIKKALVRGLFNGIYVIIVVLEEYFCCQECIEQWSLCYIHVVLA